jgi:hypothetical protein
MKAYQQKPEKFFVSKEKFFIGSATVRSAAVFFAQQNKQTGQAKIKRFP